MYNLIKNLIYSFKLRNIKEAINYPVLFSEFEVHAHKDINKFLYLKLKYIIKK